MTTKEIEETMWITLGGNILGIVLMMPQLSEIYPRYLYTALDKYLENTKLNKTYSF